MILAREKLDYESSQSIAQQSQAKPKAKSHKLSVNQKIILISLVLSCFITGCFVAYYYAQVAYMGYKIDLMQAKLADLRLECHSLEQKVNELTSLEKIEAIAVNELGMVKPDQENVVLVDKECLTTSNETLKQTLAQKQGQNMESVTLPQQPEKETNPRNRFLQAFTDLMQRWNS